MNPASSTPDGIQALFADAEWYNCTIDWAARLGREIPVLTEVFGPPGDGGILDAGCGTGHQACALAGRGYRVVGADAAEEMLEVAGRTAQEAGAEVEFALTPYATLSETVGSGFDGVYCLGNSLAAAGTRDAVAQAIDQFSKCLRSGGRMFLQILNFAPMRSEVPCVRGPRVSNVDEREYVSVRLFAFEGDFVDVTNITIWHESGWQKRAHSGRLYPVELDELRAFCDSSGLRIDAEWGSYARDPFAVERSVDLIVAATRI